MTSDLMVLCREAWLSASADLLRQKFPDGIDFRILTPRYKTLEQQTAERVHKAKLAEVHIHNCVQHFA